MTNDVGMVSMAELDYQVAVAIDQAYQRGYDEGLSKGRASQFDDEWLNGYNKGYDDALEENPKLEMDEFDGDDVYTEGYDEGYNKGYYDALEENKSEAFEAEFYEQDIYNDGYEEGRASGFSEGWTEGLEEACSEAYEQGRADASKEILEGLADLGINVEMVHVLPQ